MPTREILFNSGFTGCNDRMAILKNETVQRDLSKFKELDSGDFSTEQYVYVDDAGKPARVKLEKVITSDGVQSDWEEDDQTSLAYILNKPDLTFGLEDDSREEFTVIYDVGGLRRGDKISASESAVEILRKILISTDDHTGVKVGLIKFGELPTDWNEFDLNKLTDIPNTVADLLEYGYNYKFSASNDYYVIAVPRTLDIELEKVYQDSFVLGYNTEHITSGGEVIWDIYLPVYNTYTDEPTYAPVTGENFVVKYTFTK